MISSSGAGWLAGLGPGCRQAAWAGITQPVWLRPLAGWAATRCCAAGRRAPGLLARGAATRYRRGRHPARRTSPPASLLRWSSLTARCRQAWVRCRDPRPAPGLPALA